MSNRCPAMSKGVSELDTARGEAGGEITLGQRALRRRILAVAKQRFARLGYNQVSFEDIAHGAHVPRSDLLLHFPDKLSVLNAILEAGWKDIIPQVIEIAFLSISAQSALLSIATLMSKVMQEDEDLLRLMMLDGCQPDAETGKIRHADGHRRFVHVCRDLIARGQMDGSFKQNHHPRLAASMFIGALEGILRDRLIADQDKDSAAYARLTATFDALLTSLQV